MYDDNFLDNVLFLEVATDIDDEINDDNDWMDVVMKLPPLDNTHISDNDCTDDICGDEDDTYVQYLDDDSDDDDYDVDINYDDTY